MYIYIRTYICIYIVRWWLSATAAAADEINADSEGGEEGTSLYICMYINLYMYIYMAHMYVYV